MVEQIYKDIKNICCRLKHERSEKNIFVLYTSLLSLLTLYSRMESNKLNITLPFNKEEVERIYEKYVVRMYTKYNSYMISTLEPNIILGDSIRSSLKDKGYFVKPTVQSNRINDVKSAEYLIDFMKFMGSDVLRTFMKIYNEDRIGVYDDVKFSGLCTQASAINSCYITYMPRSTYHDNATVSHEIGHVIHDNLRFERGIRVLEDYSYIECLSTYMELAYHEYITRLDKDAHTLDELTIRNIYEYVSTLNIFDILTRTCLAINYNHSLYPIIDDFGYISGMFDEHIDLKYYASLLKTCNYDETSRYFIGTIIASKFIYEFRYNLPLGFKELKTFLCTAHLSDYVTSLERIDIDPSNIDFIDYQINKSNNLVFRKG